MSFTSLGLLPVLTSSLDRLGYTEPTPVQVQAIPPVLAGRDVIARAQTGTGKTAAFGLPIIQRLFAGERRGGTRAARTLVLVPTRELAMQVHKSLSIYGAAVDLRVAAIFGGVGMGPQVDALRRGVDVIVATPGRLIDHLQRRSADLSRIEVLILDEADRMLDMGFLPALRRVLQAVPKQRQTLLFSATLSQDVARLAGDFTRDAVRVDIAGDVVAPTVNHRVQAVDDGGKGDALARVLRDTGGNQALVFCKTKRRSDRVGQQLVRAGIRAAVIHGNKSQGARTRALDDFKHGRVNVLVATDIAARGLDIAALPLVVNYDLPLVAEDYVHRVGRTGRAGRTGHAISLVSPADRHLLKGIQALVSAPLHHMDSAVVPTVEAAREETSSVPRRAGAPMRRQRTGGAGKHAGFARRRPAPGRRAESASAR